MRSDKLSQCSLPNMLQSASTIMRNKNPPHWQKKLSDKANHDSDVASSKSDKSAIDKIDKEANRAANPFPGGIVSDESPQNEQQVKDAKNVFLSKVASVTGDKKPAAPNLFMNAQQPSIIDKMK